MNILTLYGFVSVSLMMLFYTFEQRSSWFVLGFAGSCVMASAYGFMQGAWPFGIVELIWSVIAVNRWLNRRKEESRHDK